MQTGSNLLSQEHFQLLYGWTSRLGGILF